MLAGHLTVNNGEHSIGIELYGTPLCMCVLFILYQSRLTAKEDEVSLERHMYLAVQACTAQ